MSRIVACGSTSNTAIGARSENRASLRPKACTSRCASSRLSSCSPARSEEHTSELQSQFHLVCRLLLEKKKQKTQNTKQSTSCETYQHKTHPQSYTTQLTT